MFALRLTGAIVALALAIVALATSCGGGGKEAAPPVRDPIAPEREARLPRTPGAIPPGSRAPDEMASANARAR